MKYRVNDPFSDRAQSMETGEKTVKPSGERSETKPQNKFGGTRARVAVQFF